jgi:hypothetical protein
MTNSSQTALCNAASPTLEIQQEAKGDHNLAVGQQSGGTAVANVEGREIHFGNRIYQADPEEFKRIVREELRIAHTEYGEPVGRGIDALRELMQVPEVRTSVITFRVEFEAACEQIDVVANYKALHDLLHTLEIQCYRSIVLEAKRFPEDEIALDNLMDHELTLQSLMKAVQEISVRKILAAYDTKGLTDNLHKAQTELHTAIEAMDARQLQRPIVLLTRVLRNEPTRINDHLIEAATALRLPTLVDAMQVIWQEIEGTNLDQKKLHQFQQGIRVLAKLDRRLTALLSGHNYWQGLDLELRRIEENLDRDLFELEISWPDLQERTKGLFDAEADEWTVTFQQAGEQLDAALKAQNPVNVKLFFRRYRRLASERFYQVDVTLKRLCDELREVDKPLNSLVSLC